MDSFRLPDYPPKPRLWFSICRELMAISEELGEVLTQ